MIHIEIIKDTKFEEIGNTRMDSKRRITLGRGKNISGEVSLYRVYRNSLGQIVLDPQVTVPAHEAWLFKNKKARAMVAEGLTDAREGRLVKAKERYSGTRRLKE